jgi:hypothetical protein
VRCKMSIGHIDHLGHYVSTQWTQLLIGVDDGATVTASIVVSTGQSLLFYNGDD